VDLVVNAPIARPPHGKPNSAFASYGKPIVADGPGVVVIAVDGVPDNAPGYANSYDQHGNYLVIDHQDGTFSLFAHLIPGSLKVRVGDRVTAGQPIGACGNSGKTPIPHLHWQVMNRAHAHLAAGVPIRHVPYQRNGAVATDRLERGDVIRALE
jgi:murein DD-endopeptidase MepM/ murein hydrolase activator NlpD